LIFEGATCALWFVERASIGTGAVDVTVTHWFKSFEDSKQWVTLGFPEGLQARALG